MELEKKEKKKKKKKKKTGQNKPLKLAKTTQGRKDPCQNDPGSKRLKTETTQDRNDPVPHEQTQSNRVC